MIDAVGIYPTITPVIATGGTALTLMYGPVLGGIILNPATHEDQGIALVEVLYVDVYGPAADHITATTIAIQPGQAYYIPKNTTGNVSVNAATSGHRFSAVTFQPNPPFTPIEPVGVENPCLQKIIPSYLYQQYSNDEDLQAFVDAYNSIAQDYLTYLNEVNLPVYTNPLITGDLLDWVALGLYGVARPVLSAGAAKAKGPFNTYALNGMAFNLITMDHSSEIFTLVNDDIFKRILTWKLYKGDGKQIDIRWLKRRILRFLLGENGVDVNVSDTQQVSVTFSDDNLVTITVVTDHLVNVANLAALNTIPYNVIGLNLGTPNVRNVQTIEEFTHGNQLNITLLSSPTPLPNVEIFKEAVDNGVLDLPFQFKPVVVIA